MSDHDMGQGGRWYRSGVGIVCLLVALSIVGRTMAAAPAAAPITASGGGVEQEMKALENDLLKKSEPIRPVTSKPDIKVEEAQPATNKETVVSPQAIRKGGYHITNLVVRGDADFLKEVGLLDQIKKQTEGHDLTDAEIQTLVRSNNTILIKRGYYVASLWTPPADYARGILILQIDKGRIGKMNFYAAETVSSTGKVAKASRHPFEGRYYSEEQLRRRLSSLKEGDVFNYNTFYSAVYNINSLLDVTMDTDLRIEKATRSNVTQRVVNMYFSVEDSLPVHCTLSIANSGTKATGDWRPSATIQDLNLTKHDDILSVNLGPLSTNLKDLKSVAGSYYLPYSWRNGGAYTLYGGYSDLDADNVVTGVNVKGQGWFVGLQDTYKAVVTENHLLSVSLGVAYRSIRDQLILTQEGEEDWELDPREVTLLPFSLALSYSSNKPDGLGGRNYLTSQTTANFAGLLGTSSETEIQALRVNADGTYYVERLQLARLQPLSKSKGSQGWLLYLKADGQLGSGPLIPAEQKAIGGADSVRGFPERIAQGDNGVSGTLELRTPLLSTYLGSHYKTKLEKERALSEGKTIDRLQFLTFFDAGYVKSVKSLSSQDQYTITSAGAGLRLALTKYSQFKFDWGIPVSGREEVTTPTEDIKSSGRYHFSAQVQF